MFGQDFGPEWVNVYRRGSLGIMFMADFLQHVCDRLLLFRRFQFVEYFMPCHSFPPRNIHNIRKVRFIEFRMCFSVKSSEISTLCIQMWKYEIWLMFGLNFAKVVGPLKRSNDLHHFKDGEEARRDEGGAFMGNVETARTASF